MIQDENFVLIQGWMLNRLELKGTELVVYACIYGFSQKENQSFEGSASYLAEWCGTSRQSIMENLKKLVEKKLLEKTDIVKSGVKMCNYKAIVPVKIIDTLCKDSLHPMSKKITPPCKDSLHHNISTNDIDNIKIEEQFSIFYQSYPKKVDKTDAKKVFISLMKKKITLDSILSKLKKYEERIKAEKTELKFVRSPARFLRTLDDWEETVILPTKPIIQEKCPVCSGFVKFGICTSCGAIIGPDGKEVYK